MQQKQKQIGLVWFRNDLRVNDNSILQEAIANHEHVIACYCFDPRHFEETSYGFRKTERYSDKKRRYTGERARPSEMPLSTQ